MRAKAAALAAALLLLTAGAIAAGAGPSSGLRAARTGTAPVAARTAIPVPPIPGATAGGEALPVPTLGSPYLHLRERTYTVSKTPGQLYAYYAPLLAAKGFGQGLPSESCGETPQCWQSWDFQRGQLQLFVLSTRPLGAHRTRFSLTMERIVPPQRPVVSYVREHADWLTIRIRPTASAVWRFALITSPATVARFRKLVNGLGVRTYAVHTCLPDPGSAVLRFYGLGGIQSYDYNAGCAVVDAPGKVPLNASQALWDAMLRATRAG